MVPLKHTKRPQEEYVLVRNDLYLVDVEVAVEVVEEDLGRRAGGREVAVGEEAGGEVVEAGDEGLDGERHGGVGDERVVLGGDAERGAGEVRAAADGDAGLGVQPRQPPTCFANPPRRPRVLGRHPAPRASRAAPSAPAALRRRRRRTRPRPRRPGRRRTTRGGAPRRHRPRRCRGGTGEGEQGEGTQTAAQLMAPVDRSGSSRAVRAAASYEAR